MVDFIEAFQQGQTAAENFRNNIREINSVFNTLNEQLSNATEGKIKISLSAIEPPNLNFQSNAKDKLMAALLPKEKYTAICVENPLIPNSKKELVKWERGREGYPCKITIGNKQHYCEDKIELEETLALMLQDPIVAGILADVMRLSDKQAA